MTVWDGVGGFGGRFPKATSNTGTRSATWSRASRTCAIPRSRPSSASSWLVALHGKDASGPAFGGFAGYNSQFENVVLGVEADYTNVHLKGARTDSIGRFVTSSNGYFNDAVLSGTATAEVNGYGTLRARAGYTSGPFMPFVTAGVALGQIRTSTSVTAQIAGYDTAVVYSLWALDPIANPATIRIVR